MNHGVKVLKILSLVLSLLFLMQPNVAAQEAGKIRGIITEASGGGPLPGANVSIEGTVLGATTDAEGTYIILNISPGTYTLRASMVGYQTINKTNVLVTSGRTIPIDFSLKEAILESSEITVTAEREIVPMDVSASQVTTQGQELRQLPSIVKVEQFLNTQPGIENMVVRGGGQNQIAMMVDGVMMVDERVNRPVLTSINLSAVQEISILTGGFNAEYGNIRSGVINITTKAPQDKYRGSLDYRYSPPSKKHFGPSWYSADSYYLRAYLDPQVAFVGTNAWSEDIQKQNKQFVGWNEIAARYAADDDPTNNMTPQEAQQLFMFRKFAENGSRPLKDGNKADHVLDTSLGGPIPGMDKRLSWFASYRLDNNLYPYPMSRDDHHEDNTTLKVTSNITPTLKLTAVGNYSQILSVAQNNTGGYYDNTVEALAVATSYGGATIYTPSRFSPFDLSRNSLGFVLTHTLGTKTFYNLRVDRMHTRYFTTAAALRDTTRSYQFGPMAVDEAPLGRWDDSIEAQDGMRLGQHLSTDRDSSAVTTVNVRADITSQVDRHNQVKAGFQLVHNNLAVWYASLNPAIPSSNWANTYQKSPKRMSAYLQNKLEVEGMIANFGVRADYASANTDWYSVDRYSVFYTGKYKDEFEDVVPKEAAKSHFKISPRLGVSHPVSANSKIYFNYGHFFSIPSTTNYYGLQRSWDGTITYMGNPSADWERTIAYELGYDHNLFNMFLIHLAGYYKDVADQAGQVTYHNVAGSVNYSTTENNNYADIRGFEIKLEKSIGRWLTGWTNYNYMVITSGYIGRRDYYEDPIQNRLYGLQNPYQQRPKARPSIRTNLMFLTPQNWGPKTAGFYPLDGVRLSLFFQWQAGSWITYNPNNVPGIEENLQWRPYSNWNMRLTKDFAANGLNFSFFMDATNLFNQKFFNGNAGFDGSTDQENYLESLHLPESPAYDNPVGNDKMGTIGDHTDLPNVESAAYLPPRDIFFGLTVRF
jgi:outer membrane receptor protein involved in Fe transport